MKERAQLFNKWRIWSARLPGLILIPVLAIAYSPPLQAVDCNGTPIGLSSQADVDSFQTDYGPCDRVVTLYIEGPDINNLDGLSDLTSTGGSLYIQNNPVLTSLGGLSSVTTIWGDLVIDNNASLLNLDGLSRITRVFDVAISNNASLINAGGLSALTPVSAIQHDVGSM